MGHRILIVDDDAKLVDGLRRYLEREGYAVEAAYDGEEALVCAKDSRPDLIILDLMLPGLDGFEVCRRLQATSHFPIVMLTAKSDQTDKVVGLELGATDYVVKPFDPRELVARVRAILRTVESVRNELRHSQSQLSYRGLTLDLEKREVRLENELVDLTHTEFELLRIMASQPGRVFSREQLLELVWGYDFFAGNRVVDTHIWHLRQKLSGRRTGQEYVLTVRGTGYKFNLELAL